MVFSSVPVFLDPPNWQQQQGGGNENSQLPPLPQAAHHVSVGGTSIRPNSTAERARLARIPHPEGPLKCPRCESSNTKFCYFNNYSLSQPRHFCKTCRRYWTRGGALRNVPVGGGCRRNKKSKSKSSAATEKHFASSSDVNGIPSSEILGHLPQQSQLPFMASLQNFTRFGMGNLGLNDIGLNLSGIQDQYQLPFFPGLETPTGLYTNSFQGDSGAEASSSVLGFSQLGTVTSSSGVTQLAPVKMEENRELNLSKSSFAVAQANQFWGGNSWTDLSGLNSSSATTSHL